MILIFKNYASRYFFLKFKSNIFYREKKYYINISFLSSGDIIDFITLYKYSQLYLVPSGHISFNLHFIAFPDMASKSNTFANLLDPILWLLHIFQHYIKITEIRTFHKSIKGVVRLLSSTKDWKFSHISSLNIVFYLHWSFAVSIYVITLFSLKFIEIFIILIKIRNNL